VSEGDRRGVWGGELWEEVDESNRVLIEKGGGTWSVTEAAKALGTRPEEVLRRVEEGKLLAIRTATGEVHLPRAQFDGKEAAAGVERVIGAMGTRDQWERLRILVDDGVLVPLREGRVEEAAEAARRFRPV